MAKATSFTNGADIEFNYSPQPNDNSIVNEDPGSLSGGAKKKKKKKKKKTKATTDPIPEFDHEHPQMTIESATLYDPNAEYPTSRVIKLGPSGDLVVESLDDTGTPYMPENHPLKKYVDKTAREQLGFSIFHFHNDDEREFWASLSDGEKKEILRVDKELLMENLRNLKRNHPNKGMHFGPLNNGDHAPGSESCTCAYCGRNSRYIEDELAIAYNQHLDVIANYLENCMNARAELPLNIGNPRYQPGSAPDFNPPPAISQPVPVPEERSLKEPQIEPQEVKAVQPASTTEITKESELESYHTSQNLEEMASTQSQNPEDQALMNIEPEEMLDILGKAKKVLELINPHTIQELVKYELLQRNIKPQAAIDESAKNLTEIFANIKKDDENGLAKAVEFIKCCSRLYKESNDQFSDVSQFLSNFADLIMKNDGKSFVDMLESLTDARNARIEEAKISQITDGEHEAETVHEQPESPTPADDVERELNQADDLHEEDSEQEEYNEEYDDEYPHDHDHHHDHHHDHDHEDNYMCDHDCLHGQCDHDCHHDECDHGDELHDDESVQDYEDGGYEDDDEAQRGRSQEIRGFVMIQAVNMIRAKFSEAYERKVSEDRTQKFIAELEEEEKAKKDREMKKLKAKELQKEKKRQQQLAKEEERKRKEAEDLARKLEAQKKQEALRSEQLRKKEELRLKKEEEKRKRIEALQQKEKELQEQQELARKKAQAELEAKKKAEEVEKQKLDKKKQAIKELATASTLVKKSESSSLKADNKSAEAKTTSGTNATLSKKAQKAAAKANASNTPKKVANEPPQESLNETEDFIEKEQQSLLDKVNDLSLGTTYPLTQIDELNVPEASSTSPVKNHLLEQLYRAKPQSLSSTTSSTPQVHHAEPQTFGIPDQTSFISPTRNADFNPQMDAFRSNEWRNAPNGYGKPTNHGGIAGTTSSQFSPFSANATLDQLAQPPAVDMFLNSGIGNLGTGIQQGNLWSNGSTSRNNSIWNSSNPEAQHGIWGSNGALLQGLSNSMHTMSGNRFSLSEQKPSYDAESIQKAAHDAFNLMLMNNQVVFGLAPAMSLFQIVKGLCGHQTMGMADFLNTLKAPGKYQSDFIYDDFGSVSHIKVGLAGGMPAGPASNQPILQPPGHLALTGLPTNQDLQFGFNNSLQMPFQQNQHYPQPVSQHPPQPFKSMNANSSILAEDTTHMKNKGLQLPNGMQGLLNSLAYGQGGSIW